MPSLAHVARLGLILCLLAGCAPAPAPEQPTISGGYEFEVTIAQGPGGQGSRLSITVHPPDPANPEQQALARELEAEFVKRMQSAQQDTGSQFLVPGLPTEAEQPH